MWRLSLLWLAVGCGGRNKPAANSDALSGIESGFVEISIDESEDELIGSEILQATAPCGDLVKLEPASLMGRLSDGEIRCLDETLRASDRQTVKNKLSRVLLADAWAKGDTHRWETIARRHLEEIDRSDPTLCYKLANHLSAKGADSADETLKWAEVALDNRTQWTGDEYVKRVYALYRLKAVAAQTKWQGLEERYVAKPDETLLQEKDLARNQAKTLAREWLEYARSSGKDATIALQICTSAAGTATFCDETTSTPTP